MDWSLWASTSGIRVATSDLFPMVVRPMVRWIQKTLMAKQKRVPVSPLMVVHRVAAIAGAAGGEVVARAPERKGLHRTPRVPPETLHQKETLHQIRPATAEPIADVRPRPANTFARAG